jgi:hypothetical protein
MSSTPAPEPLELQLFDVVRVHLQKSGDWPPPCTSRGTLVALLGPSIRNLCALVQELES